MDGCEESDLREREGIEDGREDKGCEGTGENV